jgi:16S rRNA (guanine1516-N2)-methyltransferase
LAPIAAKAAPTSSSSFELRRSGNRLELVALHHPGYGAICADWTTPEVRRRVAGGKRQLLGKAVGLTKLADPHVLDATAGLGRDAFVLASLGARVTLAERNPTIAALLADARLRALADPSSVAAASRTEIVAADARNLLAPTGGRFDVVYDVVYLDPMYPDRGKSALAKKELQLLRELAGPDADADSLLEPALVNARRRVVVKRPLPAPPLAGRAPALEFRGTQARFDVYLVNA